MLWKSTFHAVTLSILAVIGIFFYIITRPLVFVLHTLPKLCVWIGIQFVFGFGHIMSFIGKEEFAVDIYCEAHRWNKNLWSKP